MYVQPLVMLKTAAMRQLLPAQPDLFG